MGLAFTGETLLADPLNVVLEAFDGGKRVVVAMSRGMLAVHGLSVLQAVAADKYLCGNIESDGSIQITVADFEHGRILRV